MDDSRVYIAPHGAPYHRTMQSRTVGGRVGPVLSYPSADPHVIWAPSVPDPLELLSTLMAMGRYAPAPAQQPVAKAAPVKNGGAKTTAGKTTAGKTTAGKTTAGKTTAGKETPAKTGNEAKVQPQQPQTGGKLTPPLGAPEVSGRLTPSSSAPEVSGRLTPSSSAPEVSGRLTPSSSAPEVSGRLTPSSSAPEVSGRLTPPLSAPEVSGRLTPPLSAPEVSGRLTPPLSAPEVSGRLAPSRGAPDVSGRLAPSIASDSLAGVSNSGSTASKAVSSPIDGGLGVPIEQHGVAIDSTPYYVPVDKISPEQLREMGQTNYKSPYVESADGNVLGRYVAPGVPIYPDVSRPEAISNNGTMLPIEQVAQELQRDRERIEAARSYLSYAPSALARASHHSLGLTVDAAGNPIPQTAPQAYAEAVPQAVGKLTPAQPKPQSQQARVRAQTSTPDPTAYLINLARTLGLLKF